MTSASHTKTVFCRALVVGVCVGLLAPVARPNVLTGTRDWDIVARLTGPAGSDSINPTWEVGIGGTDLGHMVNHNGKIYFLFGDTFATEASAGSGGPDWRNNVMAYSTDFDPTDGVTFDGWVTRPNGTAKQVITPGHQPVTYIPTGAISVGDNIYAWYMHVSDWGGWTLSHAGLGRWSEGDSQFTLVPDYQFADPGGGAYSTGHGSQGPGNFGMVAASYRSPLEHADDDHIYIWGTPGGREGGVKLARVLPEQIEDKSAYRYFDGQTNGVPQWTDNEFDGDKIVQSGVGEMSVMYNQELRAWTLMYITGGPNPDFEIRHADTPWGPWSPPTTVTDFSQAPGLYSPYMNPLLVEDNGKTLYFTMSLWNPYDVYLGKVTLDIDYRTHWTSGFGAWAIGGNWSHGRPTAEHATTLDNSGTIRINTTAAARELVVGSGEGTGGTVELTDFAALDVQDGSVRLAQGEGSYATLSMTDGELRVQGAGGQLLVGENGDATATISGGSITTRSFSVAHHPSATGRVELGGDAVITVLGDRFQLGRLRNTSTGQRPAATLIMTGGTINVNPDGASPSLRDFVAGWEGTANVEMSGGTINANNLASAVTGPSDAAPASQATIVQSGGVINTGGMTLGERGVSDYTLSGAAQVNVRDVMRLGWLSGSQSTFTQLGGTVNVAIDNPATTFTGLKIGEAGYGAYAIHGGALHVPGRLSIAELAGSTGQLAISGGDVSVGGPVRVGAGGAVDLDGGTLTAASIHNNEGGAFNFTGGTLQVGDFNGSLTNSGGVLSPGDAIGATSIEADYIQHAGATLAIEIGGLTSGTHHDAVHIAGAAMLGGELRLELVDGSLPSAEQAFTILEAAQLSGVFGNALAGARLPTVNGAGSFLVHYGPQSAFEPNQVVLTAFQTSGDFNLDGVVDAADYVVWRDGLGTVFTHGDYEAWAANFGAIGSRSSSRLQSVPGPPAAPLLMALGALSAAFGARHRG